MYIVITDGINIGPWGDDFGSYVGTTKLTFNGALTSKVNGTVWLAENKTFTVNSYKNNKARNYLPLPLECDLVSYGNNIVAHSSGSCRISERLEKREKNADFRVRGKICVQLRINYMYIDISIRM